MTSVASASMSSCRMRSHSSLIVSTPPVRSDCSSRIRSDWDKAIACSSGRTSRSPRRLARWPALVQGADSDSGCTPRADTRALTTLDRLHHSAGRHSCRGFGLAALTLTDLPAQPVVELCDQPVLAPAAEKGVNPAAVGEVRGHRPPRDPARDQIADRVQQLPVTVALGPAAPAPQSGRHRQQRPDGCPLRVRHVRRIPAHPIGMIGRVAVHVRETIARHSGRVEVNGLGRVQQRQQGLREPLGMGSRPRATREPCLHARTARRSPDQELRSTHTFLDRLRYGF
ncbi:hypothetical protein Save01_04487 [Streptomyces avermitilis]